MQGSVLNVRNGKSSRQAVCTRPLFQEMRRLASVISKILASLYETPVPRNTPRKERHKKTCGVRACREEGRRDNPARAGRWLPRRRRAPEASPRGVGPHPTWKPRRARHIAAKRGGVCGQSQHPPRSINSSARDANARLHRRTDRRGILSRAATAGGSPAAARC